MDANDVLLFGVSGGGGGYFYFFYRIHSQICSSSKESVAVMYPKMQNYVVFSGSLNFGRYYPVRALTGNKLLR